MSAEPQPMFDQRVADWLEADPDRAPSQILQTVLAAVPLVPQRQRLWGVTLRAGRLWPRESRLATAIIALAIIAAIAIGAGLLATLILPTNPSVVPPNPSASIVASPSPSAEPSSTPKSSRAPFIRPADPGSAIPSNLLGTWYDSALQASIWILPAHDPECIAVVSTLQDCTVWVVDGQGGRIGYAAILTIQAEGLLTIHWVDATCAPATSSYAMSLDGDVLTLNFVRGTCDSGQLVFVRPGTNGAPSVPSEAPRPTP